MTTSQIHPVFTARAIFVGLEVLVPSTPNSKTKIRIDFATESVNKNGAKKNRIPMELASSIGAYLSVKVEPSTYEGIKHLLKEGVDLLLTVCPLAWRVDNGSGMFFDLIEVEKFLPSLEA